MRHVVYDVSGILPSGCWALVAVVWVVGAALARGPRVRERQPFDALSLLGLGCAVVLLLTPADTWRPLQTGSAWVRLAGLVVVVAATPLVLWARASLGRMWSASAVAREGHVLRTDGPYAVTRHPIYSTLLLLVAGTALAQGIGRWAAVFVAATLVLAVKAHAEERLLLRAFPEAYGRYRARVPRLVPRPQRRG
jgi:protein-S-isoprenylcysteine O-methyltransferase Ste14